MDQSQRRILLVLTISGQLRVYLNLFSGILEVTMIRFVLQNAWKPLLYGLCILLLFHSTGNSAEEKPGSSIPDSVLPLSTSPVQQHGQNNTELGLTPISDNGQAAKNIILMISDGAGFNTFDACSYYQKGKLGMQIYDGFAVQIACTTYMHTPAGLPQGYDPQAMWNDFNYVNTIFTDSAAAATAMNSGVKTTMGRVNVDLQGASVTTFAESVEDRGKSTGAVSSVRFSDATPACVWAHNISRTNYAAIAREMILDSDLDVIMGPGHPLFDDDGKPVNPGTQTYKYVGGKLTWNKIVSNSTGKEWTFIERKEAFQFLSNGLLVPPKKILGIPQVFQTLQYRRSGTEMEISIPEFLPWKQ